MGGCASVSRPVRIAADDQGDESTAASSTRPPLPPLIHAPAPSTKTDSGELLPALPVSPATSLRSASTASSDGLRSILSSPATLLEDVVAPPSAADIYSDKGHEGDPFPTVLCSLAEAFIDPPASACAGGLLDDDPPLLFQNITRVALCLPESDGAANAQACPDRPQLDAAPQARRMREAKSDGKREDEQQQQQQPSPPPSPRQPRQQRQNASPRSQQEVGECKKPPSTPRSTAASRPCNVPQASPAATPSSPRYAQQQEQQEQQRLQSTSSALQRVHRLYMKAPTPRPMAAWTRLKDASARSPRAGAQEAKAAPPGSPRTPSSPRGVRPPLPSSPPKVPTLPLSTSSPMISRAAACYSPIRSPPLRCIASPRRDEGPVARQLEAEYNAIKEMSVMLGGSGTELRGGTLGDVGVGRERRRRTAERREQFRAEVYMINELMRQKEEAAFVRFAQTRHAVPPSADVLDVAAEAMAPDGGEQLSSTGPLQEATTAAPETKDMVQVLGAAGQETDAAQEVSEQEVPRQKAAEQEAAKQEATAQEATAREATAQEAADQIAGQASDGQELTVLTTSSRAAQSDPSPRVSTAPVSPRARILAIKASPSGVTSRDKRRPPVPSPRAQSQGEMVGIRDVAAAYEQLGARLLKTRSEGMHAVETERASASTAPVAALTSMAATPPPPPKRAPPPAPPPTMDMPMTAPPTTTTKTPTADAVGHSTSTIVVPAVQSTPDPEAAGRRGGTIRDGAATIGVSAESSTKLQRSFAAAVMAYRAARAAAVERRGEMAEPRRERVPYEAAGLW